MTMVPPPVPPAAPAPAPAPDGDARASILRAVRDARRATFGETAAFPLPVLPGGAWHDVAAQERAARFRAAATAAACVVDDATRATLAVRVADISAKSARTVMGSAPPRVLSMVAGVPGTVPVPESPHALHDLDVFVCEGVLGVAENGAVWLPASRLGAPSAVVLALHVVVVLSRSAIVTDMHAAYAALAVGEESFGLFLAGPSKTADIEQSLVIGAHGATGTTVLLVE